MHGVSVSAWRRLPSGCGAIFASGIAMGTMPRQIDRCTPASDEPERRPAEPGMPVAATIVIRASRPPVGVEPGSAFARWRRQFQLLISFYWLRPNSGRQ